MKKHFIKSTRKVSLAERHKAQIIIEDLRRDYSVKKIAGMFGILPGYVYFMTSLGKHQQSDSYLAPHWVVEKVIQYGAMLGLRRQQNVSDELAA